MRFDKIEDYNIYAPIDEGLFDKLTWNELVENVSGKAPKLATRVAMCESATNMYFIFDCADDYEVANFAKYNSKLYDEDVVEVFLAASHNIGKYLEIEVSPKGVLFLGLIRNNMKGSRKLKLYSKPFAKCSVSHHKDGFIAQICIAKHDVCGKLGINRYDKIVGNAYRIDRPKEGGWALSALNATGIENFHMPNKFV